MTGSGWGAAPLSRADPSRDTWLSVPEVKRAGASATICLKLSPVVCTVLTIQMSRTLLDLAFRSGRFWFDVEDTFGLMSRRLLD